MRRSLLLLAIVPMACSSPSPPTARAPSTAPPSPPPSSIAESSPPTVIPSGIACQIPVELTVYAGQPPGGWITLPEGTFEVDPTSNIDRTGSSGGISYDRAFNRWIPADWNHVSPDGRRYVIDGGYGEQIVDVATGATRSIALPQVDGAWVVIDFTTKGVYLTLMGGEGPAEPGLWLMNTDSGQVHKLDGTQFWSEVDSRAAWGVKVASGSLSLSRLDLQTGAVTTQLTEPYHTPLQPGDLSLELIALDAKGRPLILERDWQKPYPWHLALLLAPNTLLNVPIPSAWAFGWPIADNGDPFQSWRAVHGVLLSSGIWMYGTNSFPGLALLSPEGVLSQVSTAPSNIAQIAGGCH